MSDVRITNGTVCDLLTSPAGITYPYSGITASGSSSTTSTITGNIFTCNTLASGYITPGNTLTGTGVKPNTVVLNQLTGTAGGAGTYTVSVGGQAVTSTTITGSGSGLWLPKEGPFATFQASVDGTSGAQTATVTIEASNDGIHPCATVLGTITLSGTLTSSDGFASTVAWKYIRANVTAISGTGATVTAKLGV